MSAILRALGERLHFGAAASRVAEGLVNAAEPYELGLALSVWPKGSGVLLSYNPRTRGTGARGRMMRALAQNGLPQDGMRAAMAQVPDDWCSTIFGMEWHAGASAPVATLYLEEVSRFYKGPAAARATLRLASLAGVRKVRPFDDPGDPYIWALDIGRRRIEALKTYSLTDDRDIAVDTVQKDVGAPLDDPWAPLLSGGAEPSGFILQRRHRPSGRAPLKVYKTYAYEEGHDPANQARAAWEVSAALTPFDDAALLPLIEAELSGRGGRPVTSLGLRVHPGKTQPVSVTAYWCLARGPGPLS